MNNFVANTTQLNSPPINLLQQVPLSQQQHQPPINASMNFNHHQQQQQQQQQLHADSNPQNTLDDVKQTVLFGENIVALTINGRDRLCLAQISSTLLKDFSYNEIHNRRVALGITCVQCTPVQLEMLRRVGAMPSSSRRCGMITVREAERLCRSFLLEEHPPDLPENFYFTVAHKVNYGCRGRFVPARYVSSRAKCIECFFCGEFYSPNKFIFHSHKQPNLTDQNCNLPNSPNINSWRKHIDLDASIEQDQQTRYAWEDVKSLFNGGTRRRGPHAAASSAQESISTTAATTASSAGTPSSMAANSSIATSVQLLKSRTLDDFTNESSLANNNNNLSPDSNSSFESNSNSIVTSPSILLPRCSYSDNLNGKLVSSKKCCNDDNDDNDNDDQHVVDVDSLVAAAAAATTTKTTCDVKIENGNSKSSKYKTESRRKRHKLCSDDNLLVVHSPNNVNYNDGYSKLNTFNTSNTLTDRNCFGCLRTQQPYTSAVPLINAKSSSVTNFEQVNANASNKEDQLASLVNIQAAASDFSCTNSASTPLDLLRDVGKVPLTLTSWDSIQHRYEQQQQITNSNATSNNNISPDIGSSLIYNQIYQRLLAQDSQSSELTTMATNTSLVNKLTSSNVGNQIALRNQLWSSILLNNLHGQINRMQQLQQGRSNSNLTDGFLFHNMLGNLPDGSGADSGSK